MTRILFADKLDNCLERWRSAGISVIGPVKKSNSSGYSAVTKAAEFDFNLVLPERSIKELFFPQSEPLMRYEIKKQEINTSEFKAPTSERIIFGVRPCDAAGLAIEDVQTREPDLEDIFIELTHRPAPARAAGPASPRIPAAAGQS